LSLYAALLIFILFYGSTAFYFCEKGSNDLVQNYSDALWWSFITITSVGYGDIYPKTIEGRIIAIIMTLSGMGLFALITAEISAKFVKYMSETENKNINK